MAEITNAAIADRFREAANILEEQGANPFRVGAYRRAADTVMALDEDIAVLLDRGGTEGLVKLPGIGRALASAIREIVTTGRWAQLERLRGEVEPEILFQSIPGVGPDLAARMHAVLGVDTLQALELAAHDSRLEKVSGVGPRRAAMIRAVLADMLGRKPARRRAQGNEPSVAMLLDVEREYREQAAAGRLRKIAPRRFNPEGKAWLPVLHEQLGAWHFTALYSNTARAHELDRVFDWVVIYFHTDDEAEGQRTVVTETQGSLVGQRVVRGRESECRDHYARLPGVA